jgi:hypothetical protein
VRGICTSRNMRFQEPHILQSTHPTGNSDVMVCGICTLWNMRFQEPHIWQTTLVLLHLCHSCACPNVISLVHLCLSVHQFQLKSLYHPCSYPYTNPPHIPMHLPCLSLLNPCTHPHAIPVTIPVQSLGKSL